MNLVMPFSICLLNKMRAWLLVFGALSGMLWNYPLSLWKIGAITGKVILKSTFTYDKIHFVILKGRKGMSVTHETRRNHTTSSL